MHLGPDAGTSAPVDEGIGGVLSAQWSRTADGTDAGGTDAAALDAGRAGATGSTVAMSSSARARAVSLGTGALARATCGIAAGSEAPANKSGLSKLIFLSKG